MAEQLINMHPFWENQGDPRTQRGNGKESKKWLTS